MYSCSKFAYRAVQILRRSGNKWIKSQKIIIGIKDSETGIFFPHPLTSFLHECYQKRSVSFNTEKAVCDVIVPFLNFVLMKYRERSVEFMNGNANSFGIYDLRVRHANLFLENCVEERGNNRETVERKEDYLSEFYVFLSRYKLIRETPQTEVISYSWFGAIKSKQRVKFRYQKPREREMRTIVKRKDFVTQSNKEDGVLLDRNVIRLNNIREFISLAMEVVPDIAFPLALQFFGGLRVGEVLNLTQSSIKSQDGSKFGNDGLLIFVRDRQEDLFNRLGQRENIGVKRPRDQSCLIDYSLIIAYEFHLTKVLPSVKNKKHPDALVYDSVGNPMSSDVYRKRFERLKRYFLGAMSKTTGRYLDYRDFNDTRWSTHIGRGAFTNMCLDAGFSAKETAILRGDKSEYAMASYKDILSATYNIKKALHLLQPT